VKRKVNLLCRPVPADIIDRPEFVGDSGNGCRDNSFVLLKLSSENLRSRDLRTDSSLVLTKAHKNTETASDVIMIASLIPLGYLGPEGDSFASTSSDMDALPASPITLFLLISDAAPSSSRRYLSGLNFSECVVPAAIVGRFPK
jgi:hypothetical protein